ncbi:MAG: hypothetical protein U0414_03540 [Polyangiaceae bacterium]
MTPLAPIGRMALPVSAAERSPVEDAAREFESIFVRQLLEASHIGEASGAYANLSVDAIAKAIEDGGGLGLATTLARDVATPKSEAEEFG